jgi:polyisoprenyl-phosphate glycosyltransferase
VRKETAMMDEQRPDGCEYSIVIPIYNEQETLEELYTRLRALMDDLDGPAEVVLVDDGSSDDSYPMMVDISGRDERFRVVHLSRNFGHQIATTAGLDLARGRAVVIIDADLQDPPEVVLEMAVKWREGFDIVYGQRQERRGETWFKRATASLFYRVLRGLTDVDIPAEVGDFRLIDRGALEAYKAMRENNRYLRGMFSWVGYKQIGVPYVRAPRFAGTTKYPLRKMLRLAANGIVSFSHVPLRFALIVGMGVAGLSFLVGVYALGVKWFGQTVPGWASTVVPIAFLGGVQLIVLGVMGAYIGRIYDEVKQRPLYIVRNLHGFPAGTQTPGGAVIQEASQRGPREAESQQDDAGT